MSQPPGFPPPVPPQTTYVPPPLPPQQPGQPLPIAYASPFPTTRSRNPGQTPGLLTAIGVLALLFGALAVLGNGLSAVVTFKGYLESVPPEVAPPPAPVPLPPVSVTPHLGDYVAADGVKAAARSAVVQAVKEKVELTEDEAIVLERFLADAGRTVFPNVFPESGDTAAANAATSADVGGSILQAGRNDKAEVGAGAWFTTDAGTVRLTNTSVTFTPPRASRPVQLKFNTFDDGSGNTRWCARAVDEWLDVVRANVHDRITPHQAAVLAAHLPDPRRSDDDRPGRALEQYGFRAIAPDAMAVSPTAGGMIHARLKGNRYYYVLADGRSVRADERPTGIDPVTGAALAPRPRQWTPMLPGSLWAMRLMIAELLLSTILAAGLAGTGVRALAGNRSTGPTFRRWAVVRLALSVCCFGIGLWYVASIEASPLAQISSASPGVNYGKTFFALVAQSVFPVVVLCVMRSKSVTEHYAYWRQSTDLVSPGVLKRFKELSTSSAARLALGATAAFGLAVGILHLWQGWSTFNDSRPQVIVSAIGHAAAIGLGFLAMTGCGRLLLNGLRAGSSHASGPAPAAASLLLLVALAASSLGPPVLAQKVVRIGPPQAAPTPADLAAAERFKAAEKMLGDKNQSTRREGARVLAHMGKPGRARIVRAIFEDPDRPLVAKDLATELGASIPYPFELLGLNRYIEAKPNVTEADWAAARKVMDALVEHYTSNIRTPDVVKPTTAALRKLMDSDDPVLRRHASVTYFRMFGGDVTGEELAAMVLESPHAEVRSAAAAQAVHGYAKWTYDKTMVRRLLPELDSDDPALRQLAVKVALAHRHGDTILTPREVLTKIDSPHKEVREAALELVWRECASNDMSRIRYHDHIGLATARKLNAMRNRQPAAAPVAARPWVIPSKPQPAQAAATAQASAERSSGWLIGLTAALGAALVATFGTLFAVAKFTTPIVPPPPPVELSNETPDWMRRAA